MVWSPGAELKNPAGTMLHLTRDWQGPSVTEQFTALLQQPAIDQLAGLSFGLDYDTGPLPAPLLEMLVLAAPQLVGLKALFVGHIVQEECEISWIPQDDLSPLWDAFPLLEHLRIRGTNGLSLGKIEHYFLRELILESGGLPRSVLEELAASRLPDLEHLELYLGSRNYGFDGYVEDLRPLLNPLRFPQLKYLGLRDSELADEVAELIVSYPAMLAQLETLDLSLGNLSSKGGRALLGCPGIRSLKKLDLHWHFLTDAVVSQFRELPIEVDLSDQRGQCDTGASNQRRYIAVSE